MKGMIGISVNPALHERRRQKYFLPPTYDVFIRG